MDTTFFVDFDGTITTLDTTAAMMQAFVREADRPAVMGINKLWEKKELSTRECANRIFTYFRAEPGDMVRLLESIEIDEGFPRFLDACIRAKDRVHVLSDGFDLCIRTVFSQHGIDVPYYANTLIYETGFTMECPHANHECGHCGVCKTTLMERLKEPSHRSVYIGDGYSDACPARHADMVFAKEPLHTLCRESGVDARRFASFDEIVERLYGALQRGDHGE